MPHRVHVLRLMHYTSAVRVHADDSEAVASLMAQIHMLVLFGEGEGEGEGAVPKLPLQTTTVTYEEVLLSAYALRLKLKDTAMCSRHCYVLTSQYLITRVGSNPTCDKAWGQAECIGHLRCKRHIPGSTSPLAFSYVPYHLGLVVVHKRWCISDQMADGWSASVL